MVKSIKEIVYPVFLQCCQYATDVFWENTFEDLAYGKAPHGSYISKDFLCCSYKKKTFSYKIENEDPKQLHDDVYDLLVNRLGMLSQREKAKKKIEFNNAQDKMREERKDWKTIQKKPKIRDLIIEQYVVRMKQKHNLSLKQMRYLLSIIFLAMMFKVITTKDIDYSDGILHNIKGIDFEKESIILGIDVYNLEVSFAPQIVLNKQLMSDSWEKYMKSLSKLVK
jgi:hypothetical protein